MQIRAAVLDRMGTPPPYAKTRPVSVERIDLDEPGPGEVLVKIAAAGLCHSDLSVVNGDRPRPMPTVLGHEAAGRVEALGAGVDDLEPGDHVVLLYVPSCGHCVPCASGRPVLCEPGVVANMAGTLISGARRLKRKGADLNHQVGVSAFAEYAVLSRRSVQKIDPALPLDIAALFGCAVLTGVGAVVNTAAVPAGASVAVVGLGGVGLCAVLGALAAGAERIVAVDPLETKLAMARQLGATDAFKAAKIEDGEAIHAATGGGLDYVIEAAGSADAMALAYKITRRGGTTVTVGLPPPTAAFPVSPAHLVVEERTVKGSYMGSCVPTRDIPRFISLYRQGRLPVDRLVTAHIKLDEINEAFDRLHRGEVVRQMIVF